MSTVSAAQAVRDADDTLVGMDEPGFGLQGPPLLAAAESIFFRARWAA
jgi:hypothetical protein